MSLPKTKIAADGRTLYLAHRNDGAAVYVSIPSEDETCNSLTAEIEALIKATIRVEQDEAAPLEFAVWCGHGDGAELMGAGESPSEALVDALATANVWAANGCS